MSGYLVSDTRKVTTLRLKEMKEKGEQGDGEQGDAEPFEK